MENMKFTPDNLHLFLSGYMQAQQRSPRQVAASLSCSRATVERLASGQSRPTEYALKRIGLMLVLSRLEFDKLNRAEQERLSETLGAVSGGGLALSQVLAVVSGLGRVGLSGPGITSGLAALGARVGLAGIGGLSGMGAGILGAAAMPLAGLGLGWLAVKGTKALVRAYRLNANASEPDRDWEC